MKEVTPATLNSRMAHRQRWSTAAMVSSTLRNCLDWVGEGGQHRDPETNLQVRRRLREVRKARKKKSSSKKGCVSAASAKASSATSGRASVSNRSSGFTLVSCEQGDIRQTPDGLFVYGEKEKREITLPPAGRGREAEVEELYDAVVHGRPVFHDGRWGAATSGSLLGDAGVGERAKRIFRTRCRVRNRIECHSSVELNLGKGENAGCLTACMAGHAPIFKLRAEGSHGRQRKEIVRRQRRKRC